MNRPVQHHSDNVRGILFMVMAMAGFATNDGFIKAVGKALSLGQVLMIRGAFAVVIIALLARILGHLRPARMAFSKLMLFRSLCEVVATVSFLTALFNIPIANASAILQALPLVVTVGAALIFGDKVGWRRIAAILIGLVGVLIIVRPGTEGFSVYSLSCLVTVLSAAGRDLASRNLPKGVPSLFVALQTAMVVTFTGMLLCLFQPWKPVGLLDVATLAGAAIFIVMGYFGIVSAMRVGEIAIVSPFRYAVLLFSILIGVIGFGEFPDYATWFGSAIIVATGIYTIYRERIVARQSITSPPSR